MKTISGWTVRIDVEGKLAAWRNGENGTRETLVLAPDGGEVAFLRVCCPDSVFEKLRCGDLLDAAELAAIEMIDAVGLPAAVLRELLA